MRSGVIGEFGLEVSGRGSFIWRSNMVGDKMRTRHISTSNITKQLTIGEIIVWQSKARSLVTTRRRMLRADIRRKII